MHESKKRVKDDIKKMKASFYQLNKKIKKPDLNICLKCKKEAGNNFVLKYKKNQELKGKMCISCFHNNNI